MKENTTRWMLIIGALLLTLATAGPITYSSNSWIAVMNMTFFVLGMLLCGSAIWRIIDGFSRAVFMSGAFLMLIGLIAIFLQGPNDVTQILMVLGLILIVMVIIPKWGKINRIIEGED